MSWWTSEAGDGFRQLRSQELRSGRSLGRPWRGTAGRFEEILAKHLAPQKVNAVLHQNSSQWKWSVEVTSTGAGRAVEGIFRGPPQSADIASVEEAETGDQLRGVEHLFWIPLGRCSGHVPSRTCPDPGHAGVTMTLECPGENCERL